MDAIMKCPPDEEKENDLFNNYLNKKACCYVRGGIAFKGILVGFDNKSIIFRDVKFKDFLYKKYFGQDNPGQQFIVPRRSVLFVSCFPEND